MTCMNCGQEYPPDMYYCPYCEGKRDMLSDTLPADTPSDDPLSSSPWSDQVSRREKEIESILRCALSIVVFSFPACIYSLGVIPDFILYFFHAFKGDLSVFPARENWRQCICLGSFITLALGIAAVKYAIEAHQNILADDNDKARKYAQATDYRIIAAFIVFAVQLLFWLFITVAMILEEL